MLARVDPAALDQAIGAWLARVDSTLPPTRPRQRLAPGGRRSRSMASPCAAAATTMPRQCTCWWRWTTPAGPILSQTQVDTTTTTTNQIARFQPLLQRLDLTDTVVTADALHPQREHADWLVTHKHADYLLLVKANQPPCTSSCHACPGSRSPSPTTPATAATAGSRPAACRSPRSLA